MKKITKGLLLCGIACFLLTGFSFFALPSVQATTIDTTSSDNSLKALTLSKGTLSPEFKYNVVKYTATVPSGTESVTVNAQVSNKSAKVLSISGGDKLKDGQNTIKITVEAGNGQLAVYTVVVTRSTQQTPTPTPTPAPTAPATTDPISEEFGPVFEYGTAKYRVVNNHEPLDLPEGFAAKTIVIQKIVCAGYQNKEGQTILVYLENIEDAVDARYYVFDEKLNLPCFELFYESQNNGIGNLDDTDITVKYDHLQKNYDELYKKFKEDADHSRFVFYVCVVVIVVLFIILINVIVFERMRRRGRDEDEENYLNACARNSETNEKSEKNKKIIPEKLEEPKKNAAPKSPVAKKDVAEIEFIDFDDL